MARFTPQVLQVTTAEKARKFLADMKRADRLYTCEHGHCECSTIERGPCCDEIATVFEIED